MTNEKISIIVPIYNAEHFLSKCLESLISQTYKNIEIICVNNGSTDNSQSIIDEYAIKDDRIVKLQIKENFGAGRAYDLGLKYAINNGDGYLMECDSDDIMEPTMCEEMLNAISKNDCDLVVCGCNAVSLIGNEAFAKRINLLYEVSLNGLYELNDDIKTKTHVVVWNKIFKKSIIKEFNISFPHTYLSPDASFNYQYISLSKKVYFINKKLYNYLLHPTSATGRKNPADCIFSIINAMSHSIEFLLKNNILYKNIWILHYITMETNFALGKLDIENDKERFIRLLNLKVLCYYSINDLKNYGKLVWCKKMGLPASLPPEPVYQLRATDRIQNYLSYKLGRLMIENSKSIFGWIKMPFSIISTIKEHKLLTKLTNKITKLPKIETLPDYKEALKYKNHMSYKLGEALLKGLKTWYKGGLIKFIFEAIKMHKSKKK